MKGKPEARGGQTLCACRQAFGCLTVVATVAPQTSYVWSSEIRINVCRRCATSVCAAPAAARGEREL